MAGPSECPNPKQTCPYSLDSTKKWHFTPHNCAIWAKQMLWPKRFFNFIMLFMVQSNSIVPTEETGWRMSWKRGFLLIWSSKLIHLRFEFWVKVKKSFKIISLHPIISYLEGCTIWPKSLVFDIDAANYK